MHSRILSLILLVLTCACTAYADRTKSVEAARQKVEATELAFADTMKTRDFDKFATFIAPDAVFFSRSSVLRGKQDVAAAWKSLFTEKEPPFSWKPDAVEILERGDLALSTGPVYGKDGAVIGRFTSVWRLESDGEWKIVFDKGGPPSAH